MDGNHAYSEKIAQSTRVGHKRIDDAGALRVKAPFGYKIDGPKYGRRLEPAPRAGGYMPADLRQDRRGRELHSRGAVAGGGDWPQGVGEVHRVDDQAPGLLRRHEWTAT